MRKKFNPAERADFTNGARVEWRNGRHWHLATLLGDITTDGIGGQCIPLRVHVTTRTVSPKNVIYGYPGSVRMPVVDATE